MRSLLAPVLLALLTPVASGSWMAMGGLEPSTSDDVGSLWMYEHADQTTDPTPKVYFQAFLAVGGTTPALQGMGGTSVNPNLAATDGRILTPGLVQHRALLGFWKDCNADGYVGQAESVLLDYSATVPFNRSICPFGSPHNDGQWVSEMIGIGMVDPCEFPDPDRQGPCPTQDEFHLNERAHYAPGTMVWADVGAPGAVPGPECPLAPLPPATTSGTGTLLAYTDCQTDRQVATTVNTLDPDGSRGLRFDDPEHPEDSDSLLVREFPVTLFGGPQGPGLLAAETGAPAATTWDCGAPRESRVTDPTGGTLSEVVVRDPTGNELTGPQPALPIVGVLTLFEDEDGDASTDGTRRIETADGGDLLWLPRAAPDVHDPTASWWDAAEHAADGPRGDCDGETAAHGANPGPHVEGGDAQVDSGRKDRASLTFTWYDGHRGLNGNIDFLLGPTAPSDGGLHVFRHGRGGVGPMWSADAPSVHEPQLVSRGTLDPTPAAYWTYYAKLGDLALPPTTRIPSGGAAGFYANEPCEGSWSGSRNGWVCDPSQWWRDELGRDVRPRYGDGTPYAPLPGEPYHLRDVDCYDGHLATGVFASLAPFSGNVCD